MNKISTIALAICALLVPVFASAASITGNTTSVELTSAPTLTGLGISIQPVGIAALEAIGPTAIFPITGGTIDDVTSAALIEHDGSGLTLSVGTDSLLLLNFLIDTAQSTIFGDAVVIDDNGGVISATALNDIDIFSLTGLTLSLTGTAAGAIDGLFGVAGLTGFEIGTASLDLATAAPVPLPPAVWLFGSGLGYVFMRRRA